MNSSARDRHRVERNSSASIGAWRSSEPRYKGENLARNASVDCGWGHLIFAHTFASNEELVATILEEQAGSRNLALYVRDPHVVLSLAPNDLFLDPSHTYRLWMANYRPGRIQPAGFAIRRIHRAADAAAISRLLASRGMVSADPEFIWDQRKDRATVFFVAAEPDTGRIVGTVMGIDHAEAFHDPENGASMWCLAVDPLAQQPGIGRGLVAHIADHFAARGRSFMDLSVMHDNEGVIRLYEDLGFERVPAFSLKRRNSINRDLYVGQQPDCELNPYAQIIVDEAVRRGIAVNVVDQEQGYFALQYGGRTVVCRESLTELTSAVAMSRCDNKAVTHRVLTEAGIRMPMQQLAGDRDSNEAFLGDCGAVVVKPARGEQGRGVVVNITDPEELAAAVENARLTCDDVILEEYVSGQDLRIVVIDYEVVAAAIRRPACVTGTGQHTIAALIEKQSRRRAAATGGESVIPVDGETMRCLAGQGFEIDDVLPEGKNVNVRETANLHTGGSLHDVTDRLSQELSDVAVKVARALDIPVVGLDFIVPTPDSTDYVLIEANERPGLANHEPQPTAQRLIDFLYPETRGVAT